MSITYDHINDNDIIIQTKRNISKKEYQYFKYKSQFMCKQYHANMIYIAVYYIY